MAATDIRNNPLSGATGHQVETYNRLLNDYIEYRASVFKELKALCNEAPEFAMAHLFKGYMLLSMGTLDTVDPAIECASHVEKNTAPNGLEQLHIKALRAWGAGETLQAVEIWEQIMERAPLDLLTMKLHHFSLFWQGNSERMLQVCQRLQSSWRPDTPGYAHFLGMLAFAEEEQGLYQAAEEHGRQSYDSSPDDLWALHALAHIFEMQGRLDDGIALLDKPYDQYDDRNPFRGHLWWHFGMFLLEKGEFDRVLAVYDKGIYADQSNFYLDLQNTASILARLEFCGVDVGDRWQPLRDVVAERQGDHVLAFTEPHHTIVLARCNETDEIDKQRRSLQQLAEHGDNPISRLTRPLVLPICEAVVDYYHHAAGEAARIITSLQDELQDMGGSHAQRDLFSLLQIQDLIKQGNHRDAAQLLQSRLHSRPNSVMNWQQYATVCDALDDNTGVEQAGREIRRIANAA